MFGYHSLHSRYRSPLLLTSVFSYYDCWHDTQHLFKLQVIYTNATCIKLCHCTAKNCTYKEIPMHHAIFFKPMITLVEAPISMFIFASCKPHWSILIIYKGIIFSSIHLFFCLGKAREAQQKDRH